MTHQMSDQMSDQMSPHVPLPAARTVTTPAATMHTLISPSTTPALDVAVWRSELPAGATGPRHTVDGDQIVIVVDGALDAEIDGTAYQVLPGEAFLLPGGATRVVAAAGTAPATTVTVGRPGARATVGDGEPVPVPWTA